MPENIDVSKLTDKQKLKIMLSGLHTMCISSKCESCSLHMNGECSIVGGESINNFLSSLDEKGIRWQHLL